ncbi:hypothetical protein BDY19DRAFT_385976 [Irpex rosettiformis]|uniref:Uncharacterized protein n=1 Tax=Irpex rosettiformis TaxID=378272 RepID=A0ACB8TVB2_9APHY|nr:hypothetical protein BDY19DRAFT_385976 [Irpex rosettiformis]
MYGHSYSYSNSQGNGRQPAQDPTANNSQYLDEWLQTSYDYDYPPYSGNGSPQYTDTAHIPQSIPVSASNMYPQQPNAQMLQPTWQQFDTPYAQVSQEYNYQHQALRYPYTADVNPATMAPPPMLYDTRLPQQNYEQPYSNVRTRPLTVVTLPPSPILHSPRSPRSHPPSPQAHTPSPMGSPSAMNTKVYPGYTYSPLPPAPPQVAASPPSPPPHVPHILPHPQPVTQRWRIPQTLEAGHSNSKVEFRVNGVLGIRVQDAIRNFVEIDAGEDRVLARIGARTIRLALHWPGCQPVGSYVTVKDDGQPVTRKQFANRVSVAIARMLTKVAKTQHANARFLLGTNGINTNNLWLQYVIPASQNMWIAELETEVNANNT